jgi:DNA excision repair protein ERCC-5
VGFVDSTRSASIVRLLSSLSSLRMICIEVISLETMEGKALAIDSSIWIYQFQATMRDKEGKALVNAHVLGFLRRISKLLFYGIKPVFVFDGGAPALKRNTIVRTSSSKETRCMQMVLLTFFFNSARLSARGRRVGPRLVMRRLRRDCLLPT